MRLAVEQKCQEIDEFVNRTGNQDFSIREIVKNGWLFGAKYLYILEIIKKGILPAAKMVSARNPEKFAYRIFYKDLQEHIKKVG